MAKLYFSYSTMNAGKSTLLLQASYNYRERGMRTLLFTSSPAEGAAVAASPDEEELTDAQWARAIAALRSPSGRCAPAWSRRPHARPSSRTRPCR